MDFAEESALLERYADKIAVVIPYATFGYPIDLAHYTKLRRDYGLPVVVDAAASLGTFDVGWRGFGTGFEGSVVFSMHATKSFAIGEGGLIYSADANRIAALRTMANFGFGEPRSATMAGLNGKLSEVGALLGQLRLEGYDGITAHRAELVSHYRAALPQLQFQPATPTTQAHQFVPALLPRPLAAMRSAIRAELAERGITTGSYFSPHLREQPYVQQMCQGGPLPISDDVSARMISLPLFDAMTHSEVDQVAASLRELIGVMKPIRKRTKVSRSEPYMPFVPRVMSNRGAESVAK
jgi:dTDP-4-amino-4,6-dideoxygalactose transaminase